MAMISSSKIFPAVATLLSLCVMAASGGNGNATLTLCVGVNDRNNGGGPFYSGFHGIIEDAITATSSSDRSSSYSFDVAGNYAVAQCRADVSAGECSSCLSACLGTIIYTCTSAAVRYDVCLLRYGEGSTQDLSRFDVNEHAATVFDDGVKPRSFPKEVPTTLLTRLADNASASGSSRTAAGVANYNPAGGGGGSVYGLAQCITQMKAPDCGRCLRDAVFRLAEDFNSSAGMQVLRPSCMVRYASSPFFNESLLPVTRVSVPDSDAAAPEGSARVRSARTSIRQGWVLVLVVGGGAAVLTTAALITLWCCCIRRSRKYKSAATGSGGGNYSYQDLVDATGNFSEENRIGSGGCGIVYKGLLQNNQEIAVKKLARKELKELEREVSLVAELQHENLVKFLGHCYEEGEMFLVYEYLRNKCLSSYFKSSSDRTELDWPKWLNIIKGIACGLNYLHRDSGKDIVHRDLKPSNVLLDSNFTAKIADFDLARGYNRENSHESTRNTAGTYGYIAPECYAEGRFSTKSDVYSYGVMVLEIIVGQSINRFENERCTGLVEYVWQHWSDLRVGDMLDKGHLGLASHEQMQQAARCVQVALLCVQSDRSRRPTMDEAMHLLNGQIGLSDPCAPGYVAAPPSTRYSVNGITISVLEPRS